MMKVELPRATAQVYIKGRMRHKVPKNQYEALDNVAKATSGESVKLSATGTNRLSVYLTAAGKGWLNMESKGGESIVFTLTREGRKALDFGYVVGEGRKAKGRKDGRESAADGERPAKPTNVAYSMMRKQQARNAAAKKAKANGHRTDRRAAIG